LKLSILVLISVLLLPSLRAQHLASYKSNIDSSKNNIGFSFGLSDFHIRDEYASPLIYRAPGIGACFSYSRDEDKYKHIIELTGYYADLKPIYDEYYALDIRGGFRYNYIRRVFKTGRDNILTAGAGGGLYIFLNYSSYRAHTYPMAMLANLVNAWYLAHSAEITLLLEYERARSDVFEFRIHLPFITSISRPAYSYVPGDNSGDDFTPFGAIKPFWKNFTIQFRTYYRHRISRRFGIFAYYDFQYSAYDKPLDVRMYMNNFQAGTYLIF
jgi:hypothetical protein